MKPYLQDGMYMPTQAALVLGPLARGTLQQQNRSHTSRRVTSPVELVQLARRGAPDLHQFARECISGHDSRYPDVYSNAYRPHGRKRQKTDA